MTTAVAPSVKGWCPGAYRPMMSADGLVVRVRPQFGRLDGAQVVGLCDLAIRYGSGALDLTNRANLQVRGVAEGDHAALLDGLNALGLLDADPGLEGRRNILISPFWTAGDVTHRLTTDLMARLADLPQLPPKVGFAVDCGDAPLLTRDPADFRFERADDGLILRADGVALGCPVTPETAIDALIEMAEWFNAHRTPDRRRMGLVTAVNLLPETWQTTAPRASASRPQIGKRPEGVLIGAPFGQIDAAALRETGAHALRVTPWRVFLLEGAEMPRDAAFLTVPNDPLTRVDACPGAPLCPSASVTTRDIARALAPRVTGTLHISGCPKGCARTTPADLTLVGNAGRFDLVTRGLASDTPQKTGLTPEDLLSGDF
ncbi:cobalamin biosynthesis protein CobG [Tropicibacter naphthalenivorans]|uniref:Ferredoxin-nitrite reductase n=1 Tax=Tropicibacter naphthalenivorans TaxID=441103 RepID=A0A0P1GG71_9RHOB|nr:cobalamin biosynthesis protein CobG [Tropicibacter naphthalenivorans]CUH80830.1 ferredoxin-nitrite reductase [Tropicibacter naphthalenivorans]SMC90452.1 precorrin-3B synthase [Tropicibacter naphthalenivorans]